MRFTKEGYEKLQKDFADFKEKRKEVVIRLSRAREMGDLSENGAYKAAKFEVGSIDRDLRRLKFLLSVGEVVETTNKEFVDFGCVVTLDDGTKQFSFTLVEGLESDPRQHKLSVGSPIGRAIVGKRIGDTLVVTAPLGKTTYTIVALKF